MLQDRWWEEDEATGQPAAFASPYGRVTTGQPDPRRQQDMTRGAVDIQRGQQQLQQGEQQLQQAPIDLERAQIERDNAALQLQRRQELNARAGDISGVRSEIGNIINAAREAQRLSREGWFATGFLADSVGGQLPSGRDLRGYLDVIGSNVAFERLSRMRAESPTGAALGSVTERELELLQNTIASLDVSQTDDQFRRNMETIINRYQSILDRLPPGAPPDEIRGEIRLGTGQQDRPDAGAGQGDNPLRSGFAGFDDQGQMVIDVVGGRRLPPGASGAVEMGQQSLASQLGNSAANTAAGFGQGLAAIPDAFANAAGAVLGTATDVIPGVPEWVSDSLRNPHTIGGGIERLSPTPQDFTGQGVRLASQFTGGAASLPRAATSALANRFGGSAPARPPPPPPPSRRQIMEDARAAGVPMMPADVGGPFTRMMTAGIAQTPGGAAPIVNAGQRTLAAAQREVARIAGLAGRPTNAEEVGEVATAGALRYRASSRASVSQMYDRAAQLAGDTRVMPQRALASLNRNIAELEQNPAGGEALTFLTGLRDTLATRFPNGVTVQGIRGMRTQLRDRFFSAGLRGSDAERRVMGVVNDASDDVAEALTNAGRSEAADLYRAADRAWAARVQVLDNVIIPIIGRQGERSGTQVFQSLQAAARGNGRRLNQFLRALPEDEAGTVRASIISALGRSSAGRQNATGNAFSMDEFLTHWNNLVPSARNALFQGEGRAAIERLARLSQQTKAAGRYANRSRTGGVVMIGATAGAGLSSYGTLVAALAGQYGMGLLLASPRVANALAIIASARTPQQAAAAIRRLTPIAARNPELATEIGDLQRRLSEAFSTSPALRAAAEEDRDIRQEIVDQQQP